MVTWSTWTPRSASSSSTSRYDSAKRRYHRTASTIMSGGKQNPTNADRATGAGRDRRVLMATVCSLWARSQQCNSADFPYLSGTSRTAIGGRDTSSSTGSHGTSTAGTALKRLITQRRRGEPLLAVRLVGPV